MQGLFGVVLLGTVLVAQSASAVSVSISARALQPGEVLAIDVTDLPGSSTVDVRVFGQPVPVFALSPVAARALAGIDLGVRPGAYVVEVDVRDGTGQIAHRLTRPFRVAAKTFPTRRLTVAPRYVEPPASEVERIALEARTLEDIFSGTSTPRLWDGAFLAPVPDPANSAFGSRSVFNGQARNPHSGADFSSPAGRPVSAPNSGRVVLARDLYFTGQTIVIDHGLGLVSLFAHLSSYTAREGDLVKAGEVLGQVGQTGRVTGPHLHWTVRLGGKRVDPLSLMAVTGPATAMLVGR
jgi:murein DD-endopeptidase MepM/ murein hydrolase activator NlpD